MAVPVERGLSVVGQIVARFDALGQDCVYRRTRHNNI